MTVQEWLDALSVELGLTELTVDHELIRTVLDVARDTAHGVERVAAPLTTFLLGVAVGRGAELGAVAQTTTALLTERATPPLTAHPD